MKTRLSLLFLSLLAAAMPLQATTVIPPTLDELVKDAEMIFQGTVTDVRSEWAGSGKERHIVSFVTFRVEDAVKGKPGATYTLEMVGGTVDGRTQEISDAPKFKVGDRDFVFVENNGSQIVPLVGIMHGRFRIQRDGAGRDGVFTDGGAPLANPAKLGRDEKAATTGGAISPADLKASVRTTLERSGRSGDVVQ